MGYTALVAGAALFLTANTSSAEILTKEAFNKVRIQCTRIGTIPSTGQTTPSDTREELIKEADEEGVDVIVLFSGNADRKLHVSTNIYKKE